MCRTVNFKYVIKETRREAKRNVLILSSLVTIPPLIVSLVVLLMILGRRVR